MTESRCAAPKGFRKILCQVFAPAKSKAKQKPTQVFIADAGQDQLGEVMTGIMAANDRH